MASLSNLVDRVHSEPPPADLLRFSSQNSAAKAVRGNLRFLGELTRPDHHWGDEDSSTITHLVPSKKARSTFLHPPTGGAGTEVSLPSLAHLCSMDELPQGDPRSDLPTLCRRICQLTAKRAVQLSELQALYASAYGRPIEMRQLAAGSLRELIQRHMMSHLMLTDLPSGVTLVSRRPTAESFDSPPLLPSPMSLAAGAVSDASHRLQPQPMQAGPGFGNPLTMRTSSDVPHDAKFELQAVKENVLNLLTEMPAGVDILLLGQMYERVYNAPLKPELFGIMGVPALIESMLDFVSVHDVHEGRVFIRALH